jgi:hypothetical protein
MIVDVDGLSRENVGASVRSCQGFEASALWKNQIDLIMWLSTAGLVL